MLLLSHILTLFRQEVHTYGMKVTHIDTLDIPCSICKRMDRKHKAKGVCTACYRMEIYRRKKAETSQKQQA